MENDAIRLAASAAVGRDVQILGATSHGEFGSTLNALAGDIEVVLKVLTSGPEVVKNQERLIRLVNHLRVRGYPAPEYLGVGCVADVVVTAQRRLPGHTLEPALGRLPTPRR